MKHVRTLIYIACVALVAPAFSSADRIAVQTMSGSSFSSGKVRIDVSVVNRGDEPAKSVSVEATLAGSSSRSEKEESLGTNETLRAAIDLGSAPDLPGTYTVVLATRYTDSKGYPFTALSSIPFITAEPDPFEGPVTLELSSARLVNRTGVRLRLASSAAARIEAEVSLVLPDCMTCGTSNSVVAIPPGGEAHLDFEISNLWARAPGRFPILAVVDYALKGQHRSETAVARVTVDRPWRMRAVSHWFWAVSAVILVLLFGLAQIPGLCRRKATGTGPSERALARGRTLFTIGILSTVFAFIMYHIPPAYLFINTTAAGGDTPGHHYLASHLQQQLLSQGRIVSWADGWWCGFPMFQFYFCLPYLLTSLLSAALPVKIAFKIVSVLGVMLLPLSAYLSGRLMRLRKPGPVLLALATVPFLFDNTHTMWGVNIYSTFAGMISNSISFPIMLLFIGSTSRDLDDDRFRVRTVALLVLLVASHFFTTIVAGLTVLVLPFLRPRSQIFRAARLLAAECAVGLLLMAWWLVPLVAKRSYAVDFGTNWDVSLWKDLPPFVIWTLPLAAVSLVLGTYRRSRFVALTFWMLAVSVILFRYGFEHISPVFVNIRLWPFIVYGFLALAAAGAALLISDLKARSLAIVSAAVVVLAFGPGKPNNVWHWAEWNFKGLEKKPRWPVFEELVLPLRGTPGRLANDLSVENESLGSSRVFECVPFMAGKPVLEGGLVNSAAGSLFSYYIQSETSPSYAGLPPGVTPASFNMADATRHLELFNVKHFIARTPVTQKALAESEDWRLVAECQGWELYELLTHDGSYVFIPENHPVAVRTEDRQQAGLDWIYTIDAIDQPFVLLDPGDPDDGRFGRVLTQEEFLSRLALLKQRGAEEPGAEPVRSEGQLIETDAGDSLIRFRTTAVGIPHVIKCSYYPSWKVRGADRIYAVTPFFMLVYPNQEEVELYYGHTLSDNFGRGLSLFGVILLAMTIGVRYRSSLSLKKAPVYKTGLQRSEGTPDELSSKSGKKGLDVDRTHNIPEGA